MAESWPQQTLDVVWGDEVPPLESRRGLAGEEEQNLAGGACAEGQLTGAPRGHRQLDDVAPDALVDEDGGDLLAAPRHRLGVERRLHTGGRRIAQLDALVPPAQYFKLGLRGWVVDDDLEQETVLLRFRQRVGALVLHRVLGGEDHERGR